MPSIRLNHIAWVNLLYIDSLLLCIYSQIAYILTFIFIWYPSIFSATHLNLHLDYAQSNSQFHMRYAIYRQKYTRRYSISFDFVLVLVLKCILFIYIDRNIPIIHNCLEYVRSWYPESSENFIIHTSLPNITGHEWYQKPE